MIVYKDNNSGFNKIVCKGGVPLGLRSDGSLFEKQSVSRKLLILGGWSGWSGLSGWQILSTALININLLDLLYIVVKHDPVLLKHMLSWVATRNKRG